MCVYIMFVENNLGDFMDDEIHLSLVGSHASRVFSFLDKDIKIYVEGDMGGSMKSILGQVVLVWWILFEW